MTFAILDVSLPGACRPINSSFVI